jgi:large subunit ribosomal protein L15
MRKRSTAGKPVDAGVLLAAGLIRRTLDGVRLLSDGELKAKLALTVNHASAKAKAAVEQAGGTITLIEKKVLAADVAKRQKTAAKRAKTAKPKAGASED